MRANPISRLLKTREPFNALIEEEKHFFFQWRRRALEVEVKEREKERERERERRRERERKWNAADKDDATRRFERRHLRKRTSRTLFTSLCTRVFFPCLDAIKQ